MTPRIAADDLTGLTVHERIAALVSAYAPAKGDRQEHFATLVGTNRWTVARWIRGQKPSRDSAQRIAAATGLPEDLFHSERQQDDNAFAEVQQLREEVAALRATVERLARKVG